MAEAIVMTVLCRMNEEHTVKLLRSKLLSAKVETQNLASPEEKMRFLSVCY